jgi:hypothetical protein
MNIYAFKYTGQKEHGPWSPIFTVAETQKEAVDWVKKEYVKGWEYMGVVKLVEETPAK